MTAKQKAFQEFSERTLALLQHYDKAIKHYEKVNVTMANSLAAIMQLSESMLCMVDDEKTESFRKHLKGLEDSRTEFIESTIGYQDHFDNIKDMLKHNMSVALGRLEAVVK